MGRGAARRRAGVLRRPATTDAIVVFRRRSFALLPVVLFDLTRALRRGLRRARFLTGLALISPLFRRRDPDEQGTRATNPTFRPDAKRASAPRPRLFGAHERARRPTTRRAAVAAHGRLGSIALQAGIRTGGPRGSGLARGLLRRTLSPAERAWGRLRRGL